MKMGRREGTKCKGKRKANKKEWKTEGGGTRKERIIGKHTKMKSKNKMSHIKKKGWEKIRK